MAEVQDQAVASAGRPRGTFGPVVALGLASAGLGAYAASKPWVTGSGAESAVGVASTAFGEIASSPLGTALAFVVLACWGVLLVTRGRFRRGIAGLAVLAALGYVATVAWAPFSLPDHLVEQVRVRTGGVLDETSLTGWFWLAVVAALLVLGTTVLALRLVRTWPEMGSRYDSPADAREATTEQPTENIDIWKALDEGRDPTA
jgi:uncharacterized membrane protein (TIGR02234 family)